jgi:hypothetical protein
MVLTRVLQSIMCIMWCSTNVAGLQAYCMFGLIVQGPVDLTDVVRNNHSGTRTANIILLHLQIMRELIQLQGLLKASTAVLILHGTQMMSNGQIQNNNQRKSHAGRMSLLHELWRSIDRSSVDATILRIDHILT